MRSLVKTVAVMAGAAAVCVAWLVHTVRVDGAPPRSPCLGLPRWVVMASGMLSLGRR